MNVRELRLLLVAAALAASACSAESATTTSSALQGARSRDLSVAHFGSRADEAVSAEVAIDGPAASVPVPVGDGFAVAGATLNGLYDIVWSDSRKTFDQMARTTDRSTNEIYFERIDPATGQPVAGDTGGRALTTGAGVLTALAGVSMRRRRAREGRRLCASARH